MTSTNLSADEMLAASALAGHAPSLFNVQPWRWGDGRGHLDLLLDGSLKLPETDPAGRELVISCGCALHHAALSLRARGRQVRIDRLPDARRPDWLARIEVLDTTDHVAADRALARAAEHRHVDRRRYLPVAVPPGLLADLVSAGELAEVSVVTGDERYALARAFTKAAMIHAASANYREELAIWTGLRASAPEGVPEGSAPCHGQRFGDLVMRDFGHVEFEFTESGTERTAGTLLLISTPTDDREAHLRAGEALGAMLCVAELAGLATCPLSEAFEVACTRADVRREVLRDGAHPQLVIRVGWPGEGDHLAPTPRRADAALPGEG